MIFITLKKNGTDNAQMPSFQNFRDKCDFITALNENIWNLPDRGSAQTFCSTFNQRITHLCCIWNDVVATLRQSWQTLTSFHTIQLKLTKPYSSLFKIKSFRSS